MLSHRYFCHLVYLQSDQTFQHTKILAFLLLIILHQFVFVYKATLPKVELAEPVVFYNIESIPTAVFAAAVVFDFNA